MINVSYDLGPMTPEGKSLIVSLYGDEFSTLFFRDDVGNQINIHLPTAALKDFFDTVHYRCKETQNKYESLRRHHIAWCSNDLCLSGMPLD